MTHADVHSVGVVDQGEEFSHVGVVVQRFPDAHEDDVGNGRPGILLGKDHLVQQLPRREIPDLAPHGGGAEGAAHCTAHLGGDADGVSVTIAHEDRLNAVAIGQLPQIFYGAVQL